MIKISSGLRARLPSTTPLPLCRIIKR
ncbi:hypothetical protein OOU_Y34scaffold00641g16 [Pyricularia oryzae Y34]|uniref:Uncharacterized protein n=2 Tax=Pyricularia oryzae TaxID=318829 RepID=A0AA97NV03_PYRO3|nr:hypothetical protein OOU_Y34scaffold00641g16 [Pyricularia oryzae Y34]